MKAGQYRSALVVFQNAAQTAEATGNTSEEAGALLFGGSCEIHLFRYGRALKSLEKARNLAESIGETTVAGGAALDLAVLYSQLGDFSQADKLGKISVQLLSHSAREDLLTQALLNYANILWDEGSKRESENLYRQGIDIAHKTGNSRVEAQLWDEFGTSLLLGGDLPAAQQVLTKAYLLAQATRDEDSIATTSEHRAELELRRGNFPDALQFINQAFASPSPMFKTAPQYYPIHIRGLVLLRLGRKVEALAELRRAVTSADEWRESALPGDTTSTRTAAYLHDVYRDYIGLAAEMALQRRDDHLAREALGVLAKSRAENLREQMVGLMVQNRRLPEHYFELISDIQRIQAHVTLTASSPEDQSKLHSLRLELSDLENNLGLESAQAPGSGERTSPGAQVLAIQRNLDTSEALFSFCLGRSKSFLWTVVRKEVRLYELPPQDEIARRASSFTGAIQHGRDDSVAAGVLAYELFGKVSTNVSLVPNWLIAADGPLLNGVPISALRQTWPSGGNGRITGAHSVRFLPSELLLLTSHQPIPTKCFVGIGDPVYNMADSRRGNTNNFPVVNAGAPEALARLVASDREIQSAAHLSGMPEIRLLTGPSACSRMLRQALEHRPEVVHFAVHIVSPDSHADEAAIALTVSEGGFPELLTREAIADYRVPGALVVLSGCSSGAGETVPSAGLIGLSRAWLLAGASAVLVSAWPTPDYSGAFFDSFYTHLEARTLDSKSLPRRAAIALQDAQIDMQRAGGYHASIAFWAAYSLISKQ